MQFRSSKFLFAVEIFRVLDACVADLFSAVRFLLALVWVTSWTVKIPRAFCNRFGFLWFPPRSWILFAWPCCFFAAEKLSSAPGLATIVANETNAIHPRDTEPIGYSGATAYAGVRCIPNGNTAVAIGSHADAGGRKFSLPGIASSSAGFLLRRGSRRPSIPRRVDSPEPPGVLFLFCL